MSVVYTFYHQLIIKTQEERASGSGIEEKRVNLFTIKGCVSQITASAPACLGAARVSGGEAGFAQKLPPPSPEATADKTARHADRDLSLRLPRGFDLPRHVQHVLVEGSRNDSFRGIDVKGANVDLLDHADNVGKGDQGQPSES